MKMGCGKDSFYRSYNKVSVRLPWGVKTGCSPVPYPPVSEQQIS
jgi:hypothetical protein